MKWKFRTALRGTFGAAMSAAGCGGMSATAWHVTGRLPGRSTRIGRLRVGGNVGATARRNGTHKESPEPITVGAFYCGHTSPAVSASCSRPR
jgi:hypothetical protein